MKNFSVEELKTAVGHVMLDLRGNWAYEYESRMYSVCELLKELIAKDPGNKVSYEKDLIVTEREIEDPYDGRIFRGSCELYGYSSNEGKTQQVKDYLACVLTYPEYNQIELPEPSE